MHRVFTVVVCTLVLACGGNSAPTAPSTTAASNPAPTPTPTPTPAPGTRVLGFFPSLNFGAVVVGQRATLQSKILNSGDSTLTVTNVTLPAGYSANWTHGTVAAGATQLIDITFQPTAVQSYNGTLTFVADQTVGATAYAITGTGNDVLGGGSGKILDVQTVRDILDYNQNAASSFRRTGFITRWELPVRIYVDPSVNRRWVEASLEYYRIYAGITSVIIGSDSSPRILMRSGTDGLTEAYGRGLIDATLSNNQASSGLIVYRPEIAAKECTPTPDDDCTTAHVHELGHALGIYGHLPGGVDFNGRYWGLLRTLYSLPHGTKVNDDGTWQVVLR